MTLPAVRCDEFFCKFNFKFLFSQDSIRFSCLNAFVYFSQYLFCWDALLPLTAQAQPAYHHGYNTCNIIIILFIYILKCLIVIMLEMLVCRGVHHSVCIYSTLCPLWDSNIDKYFLFYVVVSFCFNLFLLLINALEQIEFFSQVWNKKSDWISFTKMFCNCVLVWCVTLCRFHEYDFSWL